MVRRERERDREGLEEEEVEGLLVGSYFGGGGGREDSRCRSLSASSKSRYGTSIMECEGSGW